MSNSNSRKRSIISSSSSESSYSSLSSSSSSSSFSDDEDETPVNINKSFRKPAWSSHKRPKKHARHSSSEDETRIKRQKSYRSSAASSHKYKIPKKEESSSFADEEENPTTNSWTRLDDPEQSPIDYNEYRLLRLKNGLKVLIINCDENNNSDPAWVNCYPESKPKYFGSSNDLLHSSTVESNSMSNMYSLVPSTTKNWRQRSRSPYSALPLTYPRGDDKPKRNGENDRFIPECYVSLMINVGALDDPPEFQGLAHLCEHLVHHGSAKFPQEDGYNRIIAKLHGDSNAYTDKEKTNYHFKVMQLDELFAGPLRAMEMLADLISYPLFSLDSVEREIESVDNEFFMSKSNLHIRTDHLLNKLVVQDAEHPLRNFWVGSTNNLLPDNIPYSPFRLLNALKVFHRKHYYAENMTLVVQAAFDINFLEAQVAAIFENIPSNLNSAISKSPNKCATRKSSNKTKRSMAAKTPYNNKNFNKMVTIKPNEEMEKLTIMWALPPESGQNYKTKPLDYVSALIDDNSPNGLKAYLKKENFIINIFSGNLNAGCFRNKYASLFIIDALLTTKGRDEVEKVIEIIFSYLQLIKEEGVNKKSYDQLSKLEQIRFKYLPPSTSLQNIVQLSDDMSWVPDRDILYGSRRLFQFDKKQINKCLDQLIPSEARFTIVTNRVGTNGFPEIEHLYGTRYIVQEVPKSLLQRLKKMSSDKFQQFDLPDWSLSIPKEVKFNENIPDLDEPESLIDLPYVNVTYDPSPEMTTPQIGLDFVLATSWDLGPSHASGMTEMWIILLKDSINAAVHSFYGLGVTIGITFLSDNHRLFLWTIGLNYHLESLISIICSTILNLSKIVTEEKFETFKSFVANNYENLSLDSRDLSFDLLYRLKYSNYKTGLERSEKIRTITFPQFQRFSILLTSCVKIELTVTGSVSREDALQIGNYISNKKFFGEKLIKEIPPYEMKDDPSMLMKSRQMFPPGEKCLRTKVLDKETRISTVHNYYVLSGINRENENICNLIVTSMSGFLYHHLRTKQQLSYSVGCYLHEDQQDYGLSILVANHAEKFCPCEIDIKIDQFLHHFHKILDNSISSLKCLNQDFLNDNGISQSPKHFLDFYSKYLLKDGKEFRKVSFQVVACCGLTEDSCKNKFSKLCKQSTWMEFNTSIRRLRFAYEDENQVTDNNSKGSKCQNTMKPRQKYFISNIYQFYQLN